jgi:2,3-diketo-5-methylthio-1-phosphopentane phosphatase
MVESVLVSDFDGTMTMHDFYKLALQKLLPADMPDYWSQYRAGSITHFEALRRMFADIRASESEINKVLHEMELDPALAATIKNMQVHNWKVVVASAGSQWYIQRLLSEAGVEIDVHANPAHFDPQQGLLMEAPRDSPFYCAELGVDKAAVVRYWQAHSPCVAFAGDGFADLAGARLVPAELRYARADLAHALREEGADFQPFTTWSDIALDLQARGFM